MKADGYEFLDSGNRRRLERLGGVVVSRPAPAAEYPPGLGAERWAGADLAFERDGGWTGKAPDGWRVRVPVGGAGVCLGLRPAAGGQVGFFPEHVRVALRAREMADGLFSPEAPVRVLNLFAHTGLASLVLAGRAGVEVAHVDASPAAVGAARENAILSGLGAGRIRWLVDDAAAFCRRERRRGNLYQAILADPPAFGRAGKGKGKAVEWKLERDLPGLLEMIAGLMAPVAFLCLTCHRAGWTAGTAGEMVEAALAGSGRKARLDSEELLLESDAGGRALRAGFAVFAVSSDTSVHAPQEASPR